MTTKLTAAEYRALRRRPDRATLAQEGGRRKYATCGANFGNPTSEANVGHSRGHSKYGAIPVEIDGVRFASKAEGRRYAELKLAESAGIIRDLKLQPRFPFEIGGELMFTYVGDFVYDDVQTKIKVVEDVKGVQTPVYKLKKKIIEKYYGIKITEIHHAEKNKKGLRVDANRKG
jgi:Protein of unknown function (DUF1064)